MRPRSVMSLCGLLTWAASLPVGIGQVVDEAWLEHERAASAAPSEALPRPAELEGMPKWLRLGVELRGRLEFNVDSAEGGSQLSLTRVRFNTTVQPARWVRFHFQGQDARPLTFNGTSGPGDAFDVRHGYVELGHPEEGWQMRVGRQGLALGDERLVGADDYWDPLGPVFDAAQLSFGLKQVRFDVFTGFLVSPARRRPDPFDGANRISGVSAQVKSRGERGVLEPYLLWKRRRETLDLMGRSGHRDVVTPGLRATGGLPRNLDYNLEMAFQRGHVAGDRISAWAGHWELGWMPLGSKSGPRLGFEYNFASGDTDPQDGSHCTFDDLYPAGFNKYGISDPFAWRNVRYPALVIDIPVSKRWTFYGGFRAYWMATVRDGLYVGGDEFLVRNAGAAGSHIGNQVLVSAAYAHSEHWRIHAGYGQLFEGTYLRQSGYAGALRTMYLLSSFTF